MNRHERRASARFGKKLAGETLMVKIKPTDFDQAKQDKSSFELLMEVFRVAVGGHAFETMSDRDVFEGVGNLIESGLIAVRMHVHPDHIGATVDLINPETRVILPGNYRRVIELRSVQ